MVFDPLMGLFRLIKIQRVKKDMPAGISFLGLV